MFPKRTTILSARTKRAATKQKDALTERGGIHSLSITRAGRKQQRKRGQPLEVTQKIVASKALGVASATTCEAEKDCTQNAANRRSCKTAGAEDDGFEQKRDGILGVCLESVKQNL
ncbi:hypothetical protein A7Q01_05380 [Eikenella sp. NML96-A-049]|nr:hypothetical protein A7Q01_05380 [Eikenella sp. NML96-A-049]